MNFNDYQKQAITTDLFGGAETALQNVTAPGFLDKVLGLVGEAGEVAEKLKKIIRDKDSQLNPNDKVEITKELGDVLWFISALALYLDVPLDDVATQNLTKVLSRQARGQTHGSGDDR